MAEPEDNENLYQHYDAQDDYTPILFQPSIGIGPAVCHDGGGWTNVESLRAYIADLTKACDKLEEALSAAPQ